MPTLETVIQPDIWARGLEKYGATSGLTVAIYTPSRDMILGPLHPTLLFETAGRSHPMFAECVQRCLEDDSTGPVFVEDSSLAVIGNALFVGNERIGAVVAGYAVTTFPTETAIRRVALKGEVPFVSLWGAVRLQAPVPKGRLRGQAELLRMLTDTLLSASVRAQEHERAARTLAEANRAKDEFLAMLSHELRNPLGPIQIAMHIMDSGDVDAPSVRKAREVVNRQVKQLVRLLDDLLEVSRITQGKIDLRKEPVNLTTAVASALESSRAAIAAHEHSLSVSLPDKPLILDADPVRLEQIIVNLVNNAAKYTPPRGRIAVTVARDQDEAVIRIRDNGIGIPTELLPRVFDLFRQGDRTLARSGGGLGIGLTIVRNLVALHGGTVAAHSDGPGAGSEFVVRVPVGSAARVQESAPPLAPAAVGLVHVLVIEDNFDSREMLRVALELAGHRVDVAEDGREGVESARRNRPAVALVDIGLPGMDGYEVATQLRKHLGDSIRLIALTGYGQSEDRERTKMAGFDVHLVKPVTPEQVADALTARSCSR